MRKKKCVKIDKENSEKYLLLNDDKEIGYGYILEQEVNPIEIYINENERSNGYGKFLFEKLLEIVKESDKKALIFDLTRAQYRVANIIAFFGARQIETLENSIKWALVLK